MPKRIPRWAIGALRYVHAKLRVAFEKWALGAWIILVIGIAIALWKVDEQSSENHARIVEIQQLRDYSTRAARNSDIRLCRAINAITRRDRKTFAESAKRSVETLRALGFTEAQVNHYLASVQRQIQREIKRRPLIKGGHCTRLPNPARGSEET